MNPNEATATKQEEPRRKIRGVRYERKETYPLERILPLVYVKGNGQRWKVRKRHATKLDGDKIYVTSLRLQTFKIKGLSCTKCGLTGSFFAKERNGSKRWHLNLYAVNEKNEEVLMTRDHIIPRSKGGKDRLDNLQTMCIGCNSRKGNGDKHPGGRPCSKIPGQPPELGEGRNRYLNTLSRVLGKALCHFPERYNLKHDKDDWVSLQAFLDAATVRHHTLCGTTRDDVLEMIGKIKQRPFELVEDRVRLLQQPMSGCKRPTSEPPEVLYHGTSAVALNSALSGRILQASNARILLSLSKEVALKKTRGTVRKGAELSGCTVVLAKVAALKAYQAGIGFYELRDGLWMSEPVPGEFVEEAE